MRKYFAISIGLLLLSPLGALAAPRSVGDTIVYDVIEVVHSTPSAPPGMSSENRVKMEAAQNKPQSFVLTLKLDELFAGRYGAGSCQPCERQHSQRAGVFT